MFDEELEISADNFGTIILPVQYWTSAKDGGLVDGERCLLLAVLEDAVRCYLSNIDPRTRQQRAAYAEARDWFYPHKAQQRAPISFESICDLLGIEPEAFRKRLNSISIADLPTPRRPVRRWRVTELRQTRNQRTAKLGAAMARSTEIKGPLVA